jgi:hypothetical protein
MLDFLTFALCAPYSETTDGKQFDTLLEKVAARGRTLYRLFQQPSHTITKVGTTNRRRVRRCSRADVLALSGRGPRDEGHH